MTEMTNTCAKCRGPLPAEASTGRPRKFCSVSCGKAAAREIGRLDRRLSELEADRARDAHNSGRDLHDAQGRDRAHRVHDLDAEITALDDRLRQLLTAADDEKAAA